MYGIKNMLKLKKDKYDSLNIQRKILSLSFFLPGRWGKVDLSLVTHYMGRIECWLPYWGWYQETLWRSCVFRKGAAPRISYNTQKKNFNINGGKWKPTPQDVQFFQMFTEQPFQLVLLLSLAVSADSVWLLTRNKYDKLLKSLVIISQSNNWSNLSLLKIQ